MKFAFLKSTARDVPGILTAIDACTHRRDYPGHYGHMALCLDDNLAISAHTDVGVVIRPLEWPIADWDFWILPEPSSEAELDGLMDYADSEVGSPYDYKAIARFLCPIVPEDPYAWICSGISVDVARYLSALPEPFRQGSPDAISPNKAAYLCALSHLPRWQP